MTPEATDRILNVYDGTQDAVQQAALIFSGIVNGNINEPSVQKAIADAQRIAQTSNDPSQFIAGLLADAALNGFTPPSGGNYATTVQLDAEAAVRQTADTAFSAALVAESTARAAAITAEATARSSADTSLAARLTALEGVPRVVRTEAELLVALALPTPQDILIPGIDLEINAKIRPAVAGTRIRGLGRGNSRLIASASFVDDRLIHPLAADVTFCDLTLSGGVNRVDGVNMDGFSRAAVRNTFERVQIESVLNGIILTGGPATTTADYFTDFAFLNSRIVDFDRAGIDLAWEILRLRLEDLFIWGNGAGSVHNAIWCGLGMLDCTIARCVLGNVNRNGLELYYPSLGFNLAGQPGPAHITSHNPYGPAVQVSQITIAKTGNFGASFAGCKRSQISHINVREAINIGAEFIDEDTSVPCNLIASHVTVTHVTGTGVSIDQIDGFTGDNFTVDGVLNASGTHRGVYIQLSDNVTLRNSVLTGAGPRYLQVVNSSRVRIRNNDFVAKAGESFTSDPEGGNFAVYFFNNSGPGDVYFNGNVILGNVTNPLHCAYNGASVVTNPTGSPLPGAYDPDFSDPDNYRP